MTTSFGSIKTKTAIAKPAPHENGAANSAPSQPPPAPDLKRLKRKPHVVNLAKENRLPPHSVESEQGVLGCVLLSPNECLAQCVEQLGSEAESFYDLRHQTVYAALVSMFNERTPIDLITLHEELKARKQVNEIGGISYLNELQDATPSAANLTYYLDTVREKALLRKMAATLTEAIGKIYSSTGDADGLLDSVEREVLKIGAGRASLNADTPVKQLVQESVRHIEALFESKGAITGVATGLTDLDSFTDGMHGGEMVVLSGYPSTGKTSLAMNIAEHAVLTLKLPVLVFSFEMSPQSLVTRFICSHARVNLRGIAKGYLCESDFPKLTNAAGKVSAAKLHIVKASGMTIGQLRAKARRVAHEHGIKLVVIDYLQKIPPDGRTEKRSDAVALVSNGVKDMAMELDVPVLVLSQLNNEGGLFMSSETGMDADTIWKLKVDKTDDDWEKHDGVPVTLVIDKQRNGPTGSVSLTFLRPYTRFESAAKISPDDGPGLNQEDQYRDSLNDTVRQPRNPTND